ncbi:MAG: dTMP kinase [Firmicutes bacterium]|jgi:dTMP kinase|nr:dTMP kinase [Bacillota bacterium]
MIPAFVTFEGVDGSGKSTQITMAAHRLRELGVPFISTREPGGTAIGESIRRILLDPCCPAMALPAEVLLYCASRAQHVDEVIRPALASGKVVLCERYVDSTLAYQCYGGGCDVEVVRAINEFATGGLRPDLTILLDVEPRCAMERHSSRAQDRIERRTDEYYRRVREGYLDIARLDPARVKLVNASRGADTVGEEVMRLILRAVGQ